MTALRTGVALYAVALAGCAGLLGVHDATSDGEPVALAFTSANQGIAQQPLDAIIVEIRDIQGKPTTKFTGEVVLSLGNNPGGATLLGAPTATATEGTARFEVVGIDKPGTGYTLVASTDGLPAATSNAFDVVPPRFVPVPTGIPGGFISSIAISPGLAGATAIVFASAADGVYKSTDHGASWTLADFGAGVGDRLVADPSHPGVVYLAAGSSFLKKTVDGGAAWHELPIENTNFFSVALDPKHPSVVYAAGQKARRSDDGGASWTDLGLNGGCSRIAVDPIATDTLYCAAYAPSGERLGVYKSSNAGAAWGPANTGLPLSDIGILLATSKGVFASVNATLYRSLDAGASWTTAFATYPYSMAYAPSMPSRIYLSTAGGISVSSDGGASFGAPVDAGDYMSGLAVDPTSPDVVYGAASSSGVVVSTNGGVTWSTSSKGLDAHLIYSVAIAAGASSTVLTTTNTAVLRSVNGGMSWTTLPQAQTALIARFDPTVSTRAYLCGSSYFGTSNNSGASFSPGTVTALPGLCRGIVNTGTKFFVANSGRVVVSTNSGASWINSGLGPDPEAQDVVVGDAIGEVVVAATSSGIYRSINGGTSFTPVITGSATDSIVADPKLPTRIVVGACPGFQVSSDGGASFQAVMIGICVQKLSSAGSALYAVGTETSGSDNKRLLLTSTDGGSSWTSVEPTGVPRRASIMSIAASDDGAIVYLATSAGLYKGTSR